MNDDLPPIIGESRAIRDAVALAQKIAPTRLPVLLVAPTGCGKELFAQWIHRWSGRPGRPVALNCAALPESLVESELFGHGRDAFTGARTASAGLVRAADMKTLFLDEVASLSLAAQAKLLRVVETGEVRRVGEAQSRPVNVRWLAAAQDDFPTRVAAGAFRRDLYHRLAGVVLTIPSLVERPEDLLPVAEYLAACDGRTLDAGVESELRAYTWPGNVRELRDVMQRAGCLVANGTVSACAVREAIQLGMIGMDGAEQLDGAGHAARRSAERRELIAALGSHGWHAARTAAALGIHRVTLFRRLKRCGLSLQRDGVGRVALP